MNQHFLKVQQISNRVNSHVNDYFSNEKPVYIPAKIALSFFTLQLKFTLQACQSLLDCDNSENQYGKLIQLDSLIKHLHSHVGEMNVQIRDNVVPSWSDELIKKTTQKRDFNNAEELMFHIMGHRQQAENAMN